MIQSVILGILTPPAIFVVFYFASWGWHRGGKHE